MTNFIRISSPYHAESTQWICTNSGKYCRVLPNVDKGTENPEHDDDNAGDNYERNTCNDAWHGNNGEKDADEERDDDEDDNEEENQDDIGNDDGEKNSLVMMMMMMMMLTKGFQTQYIMHNPKCKILKSQSSFSTHCSSIINRHSSLISSEFIPPFVPNAPPTIIHHTSILNHQPSTTNHPSYVF